MVGNDVNMVVDRLSIGNGFVSSLLTLIRDLRLTGGLKRYTISRGYYLNNITNNFSGGKMGRYGYGNYLDSSAREKLDGTDAVKLDGEGLSPASLDQDRVGDFYSTNFRPQNSEFEFYSTGDFSLLGQLIRDRNLRYNPKEDTAQLRYSREGADEKFIARNLTSVGIGEEDIHTYFDSDYNMLFGKRRSIKETEEYKDSLNEGKGFKTNLMKATEAISDSIGVLGQNMDIYQSARTSTEVYNGDFNPETPRLGRKKFSSIEDFGVDFTHKLEEIGITVREKYRKFRITNPAVAARPDKTILHGSRTQANYGDVYSLDNRMSDITTSEMAFRNMTEWGLLDYYDDYRTFAFTLTNRDRFTYQNIYGIKLPLNEEGIYEMPDGREFSKYFASSAHTIDRKYIGSLRSTRGGRKNATYTYYNEVDMGSPIDTILKNNTMDGFVPTLTRNNGSKTRILDKTNALFRENKIKSLINRFHTDNADDFENDELITAYKPNFGLSRGRNLLRKAYEGGMSGDKSTGFDNPYCRVWTAHHQYSKMKDRIRPFMDGSNFMSIKDLQADYGNLRPNGTILSDYTTLQDNGFVKISPYRDSTLDSNDLKRYMFSIENLAWKGFANTKNLSKEQIGPNGGRIMWFPPYNLKFQENVNTSWRDHEFIGRGEKIYTYANTERGGTLSFTLLIDHPSIINRWAGKISQATDEQEQDLLRFFAGCGPLTVDEEAPIVPEMKEFPEEDNKENTTPRQRPEAQYYKESFIVFYPNNFSAKNHWKNIQEVFDAIDKYEMDSSSASAFKEMDPAYQDEILAKYNYDNFSIYSLNRTSGLNENRAKVVNMLACPEDVKSYEEFKKLSERFNATTDDGTMTILGHDTRDYELDYIEVDGHASDHGYVSNNQVLSKDRATTILKMGENLCGNLDINKARTGTTSTIEVRKVDGKELVNDLEAKIARSAVFTIAIKLRDDAEPVTDDNFVDENGDVQETIGSKTGEGTEETAQQETPAAEEETGGQTMEASKTIYNDISPEGYYTAMNEYLYFKRIKEDNNFVYKNIVDKIGYFEPAFHSLTPEGFNSRLNFLQQCTRQGPTIGSHAGGELPDGSGNKMTEMAANLAFGMAPYCILRVGDFFYSKICINAISISYETGGGVQWDLNPEGIGVQPMMADVNITFNFIGGQNLDGPVAQLQNAITSNYYANSSVYTQKNGLAHD